jgi:hypothetical protein
MKRINCIKYFTFYACSDHQRKITGYPESAFRTLLKHSDLDPDHGNELNQLLEDLPLTAKHEEWITSNVLYSANKLNEIRNQVPVNQV